MKKMIVKSAVLTAMVTLFFSANLSAQQSQGGKGQKEPPSVDEIFKEMDKDEDGKLSKEELKGPIKDDFAKIDTDEDGYISKEELEKAPKPKGRKRD
ncbi:EF-hand domain-containing protein [Arenibacter sp. F26102]|uniref:EF-hand domain-containing protein n=1 Tax=Arenibacter sp. F26102 TaxID=2926416 RepID=UPI001FF3FE60|nr:EF-hand domain-containing protein [Arenibacter sp. F26102]MCK0146226.1 EF-hand domain-containing protein [Arenibacter sp. F26102]